MATNTKFEDGDYLSLPVPAATASGAPVHVGVLAAGLNAVAQTKEGEGGNPAGFASCMLKGVHLISVTGATAVGDYVYITVPGNAVNVTNTNAKFGVALAVKGAPAGVIPVRVDQY
jgi:predicted RecA/RadA family phage recombinase